MSKFDPPADPYGDEKQCRRCDTPLKYDPWEKTWYCPNDNCPFPMEEEEEEEEEIEKE